MSSQSSIICHSTAGVCHGEELFYFFRNSLMPEIPDIDSDEWRTIERCCRYWCTFARTGNPNVPKSEEVDANSCVEWKPIEINLVDDKPTYKCLNISNEISFIDPPEIERMHFFDDVFRKLDCELI